MARPILRPFHPPLAQPRTRTRPHTRTRTNWARPSIPNWGCFPRPSMTAIPRTSAKILGRNAWLCAKRGLFDRRRSRPPIMRTQQRQVQGASRALQPHPIQSALRCVLAQPPPATTIWAATRTTAHDNSATQPPPRGTHTTTPGRTKRTSIRASPARAAARHRGLRGLGRVAQPVATRRRHAVRRARAARSKRPNARTRPHHEHRGTRGRPVH